MDKKINYTIVNKDGKVVEDLNFDDYDKLADHMLELADKWYEGVYDPDDSLEISALNEKGEVIFKDKATFGETQNVETGVPESFNLSGVSDNGTAGEGFGAEIRFSAKRPGKKNK